MNQLNTVAVKNAMTSIVLYLDKCDEVRRLANASEGETRQAYTIVFKEHCWRLMKEIGDMWMAVSAVSDISPFEEEPTTVVLEKPKEGDVNTIQ
jgi:hypothetical protein